MLDLSDVTIVAVACVRVDRTIKAMKYSMRGIHFGAAKIITSEDVTDDTIEVINIDNLDYTAFNKFVVYDLWRYIDTNFALRIEDDGFIINRKSWRKEFLNYDYIGAPWPIPNDTFSYRDPEGTLIRVGNGGFSLRSKKLLRLPTELNMEWKSYYGFYHEDGFIACHNRQLFIQAGCKFAPFEVAIYFSHEHELPECEGISPFGFHGKFSKYNSILNTVRKKSVKEHIFNLYTRIKCVFYKS